MNITSTTVSTTGEESKIRIQLDNARQATRQAENTLRNLQSQTVNQDRQVNSLKTMVEELSQQEKLSLNRRLQSQEYSNLAAPKFTKNTQSQVFDLTA